MLHHRIHTSGDPQTKAVVRYWGRKSRDLAELYIKRYTRRNQIAADFCGGTGIFAKSALELGRRAIYVDLNPFAYLIAKSTIVPCDVKKFLRESEFVLSHSKVRFKKNTKIESEPSKFFSIRCKCGTAVEVSSIVYGRRYSRIKTDGATLSPLKHSVFRSIVAKKGITHGGLMLLHPELSTTVLSWAVGWLVKNGFVQEKEFAMAARFASRCISCGRQDMALPGTEGWLIQGNAEPVYWYPVERLNYADGTRFLKRRDVRAISELFTSRNLVGLTSLWHDIDKVRTEGSVKNCLRLAFMATLARSSKMCREKGGTWPVNSYWIPRTYLVRNPYLVFRNAVDRVARMLMKQHEIRSGSIQEVVNGRSQVSLVLADSTKLRLPNNSVDYVIVDPPHTDEAQFFELSLFYTAWLKRKLDFKNELIINKKQGKDAKTYLQMLRSASQRVYDSLKSDGHYTMILHDTNRNFLHDCRDTVKSLGFRGVIEDFAKGYTIYTFRK
jgi:hypothetical protein